MIETKIGNITVRHSVDIDEIPVKRYNLFNEYSILESDIGSDIGAIDNNFRRLHGYMMSKKFDEAVAEASSLHQSFWNVLQHKNFKALQYAVLISEVNGKKVFDHSEENLVKIIDQLSANGLNMAQVKVFLQDVKKKFLNN